MPQLYGTSDTRRRDPLCDTAIDLLWVAITHPDRQGMEARRSYQDPVDEVRLVTR